MLSQSAKHEGGWRILKLKTKSEIFLIQHKQQRIAGHPRVSTFITSFEGYSGVLALHCF